MKSFLRIISALGIILSILMMLVSTGHTLPFIASILFLGLSLFAVIKDNKIAQKITLAVLIAVILLTILFVLFAAQFNAL